MNWNDASKQLAADAVYGTVAYTGEKLPSREFTDKLLEKVAGHIEAVADMKPGYSPAEKALEAMGVPVPAPQPPTKAENARSIWAARQAAVDYEAQKWKSVLGRKGETAVAEAKINSFKGDRGFVTKDSGERRVFPTGSQRDVREGKGRYDLLPAACIRRLAQLYERGAKKYGDRNWQKGQPLSSTVDSLLRHAFQYLEGERTEDHLAAVAWNAFTLMWTEEQVKAGKLPKELNDLETSP